VAERVQPEVVERSGDGTTDATSRVRAALVTSPCSPVPRPDEGSDRRNSTAE